MKNGITIRQYKITDFKKLVEFEEKLQDLLVEIDPMKLLIRSKDFGKIYTKEVIEKVKKYNGAIYIAETNDRTIGFISGIINKSTKRDDIECIPLTTGRVTELYVEPEFRGKNIGSILMKKIEKYFKKNKCRIMRVEVFEPNTRAHKFYEKCGFNDRVIDMIKKI